MQWCVKGKALVFIKALLGKKWEKKKIFLPVSESWRDFCSYVTTGRYLQLELSHTLVMSVDILLA